VTTADRPRTSRSLNVHCTSKPRDIVRRSSIQSRRNIALAQHTRGRRQHLENGNPGQRRKLAGRNPLKQRKELAQMTTGCTLHEALSSERGQSVAQGQGGRLRLLLHGSEGALWPISRTNRAELHRHRYSYMWPWARESADRGREGGMVRGYLPRSCVRKADKVLRASYSA